MNNEETLEKTKISREREREREHNHVRHLPQKFNPKIFTEAYHPLATQKPSEIKQDVLTHSPPARTLSRSPARSILHPAHQRPRRKFQLAHPPILVQFSAPQHLLFFFFNRIRRRRRSQSFTRELPERPGLLEGRF